MGAQAPPELLGIHTSMPGAVPPDIDKAALAGAPAPAGLSADEKHAYEQLVFFYKQGLGYALEMKYRPQTLYALADSPVGLAAWMIDHDAASYALIARVFAGQTEGLTRDDILDNITLYWLTNTGVSSARLYAENKLAFFAPKGVAIPVAVSAVPDELYHAPRSWVERAYPKLIYYNKLAKGGHFAAWEQPDASWSPTSARGSSRCVMIREPPAAMNFTPADDASGRRRRRRRRLGAVPHGTRVIAPITGGTFEGPRLRGKVLPGRRRTGPSCGPTACSSSICGSRSRPTTAP